MAAAAAAAAGEEQLDHLKQTHLFGIHVNRWQSNGFRATAAAAAAAACRRHLPPRARCAATPTALQLDLLKPLQEKLQDKRSAP